jgi:hypothetical protein
VEAIVVVVELPVFWHGDVVAYTRVDLVDAVDVAHMRWHLHSAGYALSGPRGDLLLHRVVLGLVKGDGMVVDHVNGDRLDNRRANLRAGDQSVNLQNQSAVNGYGSSRYRGVSWDARSGKWRATGNLAGRRSNVWLGLFATEDEAAARVAEWRRRNHPYSPEAVARGA